MENLLYGRILGNPRFLVSFRDIWHESTIDSEDFKHCLDKRQRVLLEIFVQIDMHLLATEGVVVALHLLVIQSHALKVPKRVPLLPDSLRFFLQRAREGIRFAGLSNHVQVSGVGAIGGVPQQREHSHPGNVLLNLHRSLGQVERIDARFADCLFFGHAVKERCVIGKVGDDAAVVGSVLVLRAIKKPVRPFVAKKSWLFRDAHENLRMLLQVSVQRSGPALGGANN